MDLTNIEWNLLIAIVSKFERSIQEEADDNMGFFKVDEGPHYNLAHLDNVIKQIRK